MKSFILDTKVPQCAAIASDSARRVLDIAIASLAILLLGPVFLLIAAAIIIESGRPVFYSQLRIGQHGRPFRMVKFRKFRSDLNVAGLPLTLEDDPRLTHVGKALRATKLDELPQLWNVIKGNMAIVGPRPEVLDFADCFKGELRQILHYRPGILGPSQFVLRNESSLFPGDLDLLELYRVVLFPMKGQIDLWYYERRTLLKDLRWMLLTVIGVLRHDQSLAARLEYIEGWQQGLLGRLVAGIILPPDDTLCQLSRGGGGRP